MLELPSSYLAAQQATVTWRGKFPERVVSWWIWWLSTAAAAGYLLASARRWWHEVDFRGSRVVWLIPMLALLAFRR